MATFAEVVEQLDNLSTEELVELKRIVEKKWMRIREQEIIKAEDEIEEHVQKERNISKLFGINPMEVDGMEFQKKVRNEWDGIS